MVLLAYAISIIRTELARRMNKTFSFTYNYENYGAVTNLL